MPSSFGQYQGGIAPVQGISEAGARIGQMAESGYANFGKSLADGIKAYNDNDQKNQVLTQQLQGLAAQYQEVYDMYSKNPEMKPFADSLVPTMEQLNKFGSMSLSQKSGALLSGQAAYNQIAPHLQMFKDNQTSMTKQGVQSALSKEVIISDNQGGYVKGTPFSTASTIDENLALARKSFEVQAKVGNLKSFDIESALSKLTAQWENSFANDPNMAKNDPALRGAILKNISDYRNQGKLAGELAGQSSEDYGTGENIMGQVGALSEAQKGASTSAAKALEDQDMAATLAAQKKLGITIPSNTSKAKEELTAGDINKHLVKTSNDGKLILNKNWEALKTSVPVGDIYRYIENDAKRAGTWNKAEYDKAVAADKVLEGGVNYYQRKAPNENAYYDSLREKTGVAQRKQAIQDPRVADFAKGDFGETGIPVEALKLAETLGFQRSDYGIGFKGFGETLPFGIGAVLAPAGYGEATNELPRALKDFFGRVKEGKYDKTTGVVDTGRPTDAGKNDWIQPIKKQSVESLKPIWEQASKTGEVKSLASETKPEVAPVNKYAKTFDFNAQIQEGVKEGFRQETFAEEKERVRQWFVTNNKGIIPSSLDEVYSSIRPETSVRFMDAPDGGKVMITPKGAQYIPPVKTTAVTAEQISKNTLYSYGTRTPDGQIIPEERAKGSGIKLAGIASGGEEGAKDFKKLHDDTVKARIIIPKLLAMYKQGKISRTLIPQAMWGDAESLLAQLKAAIRVETVGTGPVALPEHAMILERIGDPRKFFQFDTIGESKLNSIMKSMEDSLVHNSAGISVSISPSKTDFASSVQQAKLEATRAKK